ncbi:energy transducer TonB [Thalassobius sp. S69A]|uniref:energy transducer TonB n=1 Tax=unclassified Thalassovita TaxID=2619711 RepID=UPI000C11867C|nr:energy transducer TonB [Paracoccaceae bacterium]MBT27082.1 energy transducer TonB [Paracoccaceae bacterium]
MNAGQYISGIGHVGLIGWLLVGDVFAPAPEPFEVTEVAVISPEEYERIVGAQQPPAVDTEAPAPVQPVQPDPREESAPQPIAEPDTPPERPVPEPVPETPPQDDSPDVTEIVPPPPAEVQDTPPEIAPPPAEDVVLAPRQSVRPKPRPAPRVAPEPVAQPAPETKPDDITREEVRKDDAGEVQKEETEATAPEEAADEIVTEAEDPPSGAPASSRRPKSRPSRPDPAQDDMRSAIEKAVADAAGSEPGPATDTPAAPAGPPLTAGEKDALRIAVQRCWNTGSLSSDALRTTVIVAVRLSEAGKPDVGSIRMVSSSGGTASSARQAYEAARRAIIRCGSSGFNLPKDKYAQWRDIEMTFNPEKMRIK